MKQLPTARSLVTILRIMCLIGLVSVAGVCSDDRVDNSDSINDRTPLVLSSQLNLNDFCAREFFLKEEDKCSEIWLQRVGALVGTWGSLRSLWLGESFGDLVNQWTFNNHIFDQIIRYFFGVGSIVTEGSLEIPGAIHGFGLLARMSCEEENVRYSCLRKSLKVPATLASFSAALGLFYSSYVAFKDYPEYFQFLMGIPSSMATFLYLQRLCHNAIDMSFNVSLCNDERSENLRKFKFTIANAFSETFRRLDDDEIETQDFLSSVHNIETLDGVHRKFSSLMVLDFNNFSHPSDQKMKWLRIAAPAVMTVVGASSSYISFLINKKTFELLIKFVDPDFSSNMTDISYPLAIVSAIPWAALGVEASIRGTLNAVDYWFCEPELASSMDYPYEGRGSVRAISLFGSALSSVPWTYLAYVLTHGSYSDSVVAYWVVSAAVSMLFVKYFSMQNIIESGVSLLIKKYYEWSESPIPQKSAKFLTAVKMKKCLNSVFSLLDKSTNEQLMAPSSWPRGTEADPL